MVHILTSQCFSKYTLRPWPASYWAVYYSWGICTNPLRYFCGITIQIYDWYVTKNCVIDLLFNTDHVDTQCHAPVSVLRILFITNNIYQIVRIYVIICRALICLGTGEGVLVSIRNTVLASGQLYGCLGVSELTMENNDKRFKWINYRENNLHSSFSRYIAKDLKVNRTKIRQMQL